ncbi:ribonuclease Y [Streptacidiphilus melanogenes]|uniref:ribonuclease Y n=1 Tax=Streptacidiphilus melanogenes TaxID=411235 RepID=UPI000694176B|nr:ribonuclease Y [Streptacidiphilus melanogenes]
MTLAIAATATVPVLLMIIGLVLLSVAGLAVRQLLHSARERALELDRREQRSAEREARIDEEQHRLLQRELDTAQAQAELQLRSEELAVERRRMLEEVAGLSAADARAELVRSVEQQAKRDAVLTVREIERQARTDGEVRAREIVASAIQRVSVQGTADHVVTAVRLPGEDMKGRIIGREGRNIRSFEAVTGVNLVIDETPESVLLSCFDPVRREVGRLALEELIADGRIHPQRIEDAYERSLAQVERLCRAAAEEAVAEVGLDELHPELMRLLGRLRYRTSYGQNVLGHLVESAHLAGAMAAELRVDPMLVKRCSLLHDIGKAVTLPQPPGGSAPVAEGSHAQIGAELARRYGESEEVVHAVAAHHNEIEPQTVEAVLTQAADACSGGRPGARRESVELHARRLEKLEEIARRHEGVHKVYAMQAGREVRVMVLPEAVDDVQAQVLAKDVAREVENELTYPGQIRITVIRESRATSFAR